LKLLSAAGRRRRVARVHRPPQRPTMKPPPFKYHDPTSLAEALDLLADLGDDAKILAGGQSLIVRHNPRPTEQQVRDMLAGNLCRCTGYRGMVDAVPALVESGRLDPPPAEAAP
jgi:hypothetical protein